jgi:hypothetical protein
MIYFTAVVFIVDIRPGGIFKVKIFERHVYADGRVCCDLMAVVSWDDDDLKSCQDKK